MVGNDHSGKPVTAVNKYRQGGTVHLIEPRRQAEVFYFRAKARKEAIASFYGGFYLQKGKIWKKDIELKIKNYLRTWEKK